MSMEIHNRSKAPRLKLANYSNFIIAQIRLTFQLPEQKEFLAKNVSLKCAR